MNSIQPEWLSGFIGVIAPLIVHWIAKENFTRKQKSLFAILVSSVIGFASAYLSGQFNTTAVLKSISAAFAISQIVYDQLFKDIFNNNNSNSNKEEMPFT
jgi:MFS-type transporter involved in bile tolerance (Atg22 family)